MRGRARRVDISADRYGDIPAQEQRRVLAELGRQISLIDPLEPALEAGVVRAGQLRQTMLNRAFEGQLVPQDPTDEPAGKLLERMRAARVAHKTSKKIKKIKKRASSEKKSP